jgi:serine/threonine-protein kinase
MGQVLSESGMATIYLAEDADNQNQAVVVKVPHMKFESDPAYAARFQREEKIGLQLNHPYLLKFIPTAGRRSRPYLVTEYLRGRTLAQTLTARKVFPEKEALSIASRICEGLKHLHAHGFIHRDLKPDNIMLCEDGSIRIMDFGLAADVDSSRGFFSRFIPIFGTPQYMAPEQINKKPNDERTDLYSLGLMLYEMLTGKLPCLNEDPWVMAQLRANGDPEALRKLNPAISPAAEEIVLHAMQRNPAARHASIAALQQELDAPERIQITNLCDRLQAPRPTLSLEAKQMVNGIIWSIGFLLFLVLMFFFLRNHLGRH